MVIAERPTVVDDRRPVILPDSPTRVARSAAARLDRGELRSQTFSSFGDQGKGSRSEKRREKRADSRRKKSFYHAELVRQLNEMAESDAIDPNHVLEPIPLGQPEPPAIKTKHGLMALALALKVLPAVKKCPGVVRKHGPCGNVSFLGQKCSFKLCPWCQARRSRYLQRRIRPLVEAMEHPKFWTFNPPNLKNLTPGAVAALQGVLADLHRLTFLKGSSKSDSYARSDIEWMGEEFGWRVLKVHKASKVLVRPAVYLGGFRSIEVTNKGNGWNLHGHELGDSGWVAQYPQTDIAPRKGKTDKWLKRPWAVVVRHPGLAREFTRECQKYDELREIGHCLAGRHEGFNLDCPDCWYFVDMRQANAGAILEIAKYVVKGSQVVKAGAGAILDFCRAVKGKQTFKPFGKYHGFKIEDDDDDGEEPSTGEDVEGCPWPECPAPALQEWEYVSRGYPAGAEFQWDKWAKSSRVVFDTA